MSDDAIPLCDPDMSQSELDAVQTVIASPRLGGGHVVEALEHAWAERIGRAHAVAVASGTIALLLCLRARGVGEDDEVVASSYSWHQIAHAIALAGARPVFADIDYWTGTIAPEKILEKLGAKTRAIVAGNVNGHPAAWGPLRNLAEHHDLVLLEDSSEAIGSCYQGRPVGSFGDCAIFDLSQPGTLVAGEGAVIVTDDAETASRLRCLRGGRHGERFSSAVAHPPLQVEMSDLTAAVALAQLERLDGILARRKTVEGWYEQAMRSFEGIKPPYLAPEVTEHHWFLYVVHLGTRFARSSRDAIVDDMRTEHVEATAYCSPLHTRAYYARHGYRRGTHLLTEKVADRSIALPFHGHLTPEQVAFIVKTAKDASINVGAGSAIYL